MRDKASSSLESNGRRSGILLHPTSFPSPFGIGDLGYSAYEFIDFLKNTHQRLWQVLPLGPTGYGDSPYQAFSSFAGQPLIISPDKLMDIGLLNKDDIEYKEWNEEEIDYGPVIEYKNSILEMAFENFQQTKDKKLIKEYNDFCEENNKNWLENYSLFMAVKEYHNGVTWTKWNKEIAFPTKKSKDKWINKLEKRIKYYKFIQFIFFKQWFELKAYANKNEIEIIGDIPIFVAFDSSDVWANKELFFLDENGYPVDVAGVPPDYFSETGQLWGNPLYDWDKHKKTKYKWWIKRISSNLKLVDILRIDHFRGFESYWAVPFAEETAINGEWRKGPGSDLFIQLRKELGEQLPIIAEDLGVITKEVRALRDEFNFPGMKILQFAFEDLEENAFLPHNYTKNSIAYSGTHDNDTTYGWYQKASQESKDKVRRYMNTDGFDVCWDFIRACFGSVSNMAVVPLQDVLSYNSWARMNVPSVAAGNWSWRYKPHVLEGFVIDKLLSVTTLYGRDAKIEE